MDVPKCSIWALHRVIADPFLHDSSLCTLLNILLPNQEYRILKRIGMNTLQTVRFARLRLVFKLQLSVKHGCNFYSCKMPSLSPNNITMMDFLPIDPREELRRKPIISIFGTKGRCFQCWRDVYLAKALNQRTKSDWTEFMCVECCIEQTVTGYASLIKLMLFLV